MSVSTVPSQPLPFLPQVSEVSLYASIVDSMICGVMLIDSQGRITAFNRAASQVLGLRRDDVLGATFAERFLGNEGLDEFNEAVLAAVYDGDVGHQSVVTVRRDERAVPVSVATSFLRDLESGDGAKPLGVVAMFTDISELERLRTVEIDLARSLAGKHEELREAYRALEGRNAALDAALRRRAIVRRVAAGALVVFAAGVGVYLWQASPARWFDAGAGIEAPRAGGDRIVAVERVPIKSTLRVESVIAPLRERVVTSPIEGRVGVVHVGHGATVRAGDLILDLDVGEVESELAEARLALLRAERRSANLAAWSQGPEVAQAQRSLTRSELSFEAADSELRHMRFLAGEGLVPEARLERAERALQARTLDRHAAREGLEAVLVRGREDREVAEIELQQAQAAVTRLERMIATARVVAPAPGIVLLGAGSSAPVPRAGSTVEAGDALVRLADISGVSVRARVDEVEVRRIELGAPVRITGPAFPDITLEGRIVHVSSQAASRKGAGVPTFDVVAEAERLPPEVAGQLRLGMSADLSIVVYERDDALVVPVRALRFTGSRAFVRVRPAGGGADRKVEVEPGVTTPAGVEIRAGLEAGDEVLVR